MFARVGAATVGFVLAALFAGLLPGQRPAPEPCGDAPWAEQELHRLEAYFTDDEWDGVRAEGVRQLSPDTEGSRVRERKICTDVIETARRWMRENLTRAEPGGGPPPWSPKVQEWAVFRYGPYVAVEIAFRSAEGKPNFERDFFFVFDGDNLKLLGHALV